jgi:hypothetical protein
MNFIGRLIMAEKFAAGKQKAPSGFAGRGQGFQLN